MTIKVMPALHLSEWVHASEFKAWGIPAMVYKNLASHTGRVEMLLVT